MRQAEWFSSTDLKLEKKFGNLEIARARCLCRAVVAFKCYEDASFYATDAPPNLRDVFRLPPGCVHRDDAKFHFGYWELSRRAERQRRSALLGGESLSEWRPTPRHRQSQELHERVIGDSSAIVGVLGTGEGSPDVPLIYMVDPVGVPICLPYLKRLTP